jgi:hypothetical protein
MNTMISNEQQSIYKLIINIYPIIDGENYIEMSLIPDSFLLSPTFLEEISDKKISKERTLSYLAANYTVFLLIDLKTGLCWDSNLKTYTCWIKGVTEVVNHKVRSVKEITYLRVSKMDKDKSGLFNASKFSSHLKMTYMQ